MRLRNFMNVFNDGAANALKVLDYAHHEIHGGSAFLAVYSLTRDNTEFIEMRFRPLSDTKRVHMVIHLDAALAATAEMWKATTKLHVTANAITPMNRDFTDPKASILSVCHTPGGSQAGNADLIEYIGSAAANGRSDIGGGSGSRSEFILNPWEDYLVKFTSRANSNALTITLDWYEHTHKV